MIFTGNGYSAEWPVEAQKRGLPNLNTTPKAVATWNSDKNKRLGRGAGGAGGAWELGGGSWGMGVDDFLDFGGRFWKLGHHFEC